MDLLQLRYFQTAARHENFSRAAEELFITQPALTKCIQNLEKELGVRLFDRKGRSVSLNETGKATLEHVDRILNELSELRTDAQKIYFRDRSISVASNLSYVVDYMLPDYDILSGQVTLNIHYLDQTALSTDLLTSRSYDVLVSDAPLKGKGVVSHFLWENRPAICVPADHYLAGKRFIHFSDITEELSVLDPASRSGQHQSREFQKLLQEKQVPVSYISTVNESTRDYTLKYSSYCSFSSLMDLIFHSIENRYYCFLDEPETVSSIYISYLKEKATELSPFTDWFQKRPEILGRFIEELLA